MLRWLCLVVLCLVPVAASAQQTSPVYTSEEYRLTADHNGQADGYRIFINGTKVGSDILMGGVWSGGVVTVPVPGQPRGTHSVVLAAFKGTVEARSTALTITVADRPPVVTPPTNLRVRIDTTQVFTVSATGVFTLESQSSSARLWP